MNLENNNEKIIHINLLIKIYNNFLANKLNLYLLIKIVK